jgi:myo-inositol 2-dehydrogenase / D-chiro-inositol 1-dehydrogenase
MITSVGIIGTGIMGADHAQILHRFVSGAELVLVADVDLGRAESVADLLGCRATGNALALIDDAEVDAILVASHDSTHAEFVLASVNAHGRLASSRLVPLNSTCTAPRRCGPCTHPSST